MKSLVFRSSAAARQSWKFQRQAKRSLFDSRLRLFCSLPKNHLKIENMDDWTDQIIESASPVIVQCSADWCGPCRALTPILQATIKATDKDEKLKYAKIDIDDLPEIADMLGVTGIPHVVIIKGGSVIDEFSGVKMGDELEKFVLKALQDEEEEEEEEKQE